VPFSSDPTQSIAHAAGSPASESGWKYKPFSSALCRSKSQFDARFCKRRVRYFCQACSRYSSDTSPPNSWLESSIPPSIKYATPGSPRSNRRKRAFLILLIGSVCYLAGLIVFELVKMNDIGHLIARARELPSWDPYTIDFWAYILAFPLMTLIALFPVLAAMRGLSRRSPQALMIVYAMLQVLVIVIHWVATTNLIRHGRFSYTKDDGGTYIFVVFSGVLRTMPMDQIIFSLPLLLLPLLLIRRVRQIFSVGPTSQS
jgi:hypothetical protein